MWGGVGYVNNAIQDIEKLDIAKIADLTEDERTQYLCN
jgi:hypothetical protein